MNPPQNNPKAKGLYLRYDDFCLIESIIHEVPESDMTPAEKYLLWKVKTIKYNIECARLRSGQDTQSEAK